MSDEKKRVVLKKNDFTKIKKNAVVREIEVELPELSGFLGFENGEVPIVVVRQLTLTEYLSTKLETSNLIRSLADKLVESAGDRYGIDEDVIDALKNSDPETRQRIDIVHSCLVDPKLGRQDVVYLAKMFPFSVAKLFTSIMDITSKGADLKKNSTNS